MKVRVTVYARKEVEIDDKFAQVLKKVVTNKIGTFTNEEDELWDELLDLAEENEWLAGYTADDDEDVYWE